MKLWSRLSAALGTSVTVASQPLPQAQRDAVRLYGFDDTHVGVLREPEVSALLNRLLGESY